MTETLAGAGVAARADAVKDPIAALGGAFMLSEQAKAAGKALGTGGWGLYMIGRAGVLGDVDPSVVEAALWFFPIERVSLGWSRGRAALTPAEGAARFAEVCHEWSRAHLAAVPAADLERLAALLETVAREAPVAGAPLFAGWRALPLPADPPARVGQLSHVLREYRGARHGIAAAASGLSPLDAVVAGGGAGNAAFFGWPEPYPDPAPLAAARTAAESLTDAIVGPAWVVLSEEEFAECAALLLAVRDAALASFST